MENIKTNKPFYKKAWFLVVTTIALFGIIIPALMYKSNIQNAKKNVKDTQAETETTQPQTLAPLLDKTETEIFKEIESRLKEYEKTIKKYYPSQAMFSYLHLDWLRLNIIISKHKDATDKDRKQLYTKAKTVLQEVEVMRRKVFAKLLGSDMLESHRDYKINAIGKNSETLKIQYILMSRPLVHTLINDPATTNVAQSLGFKKVIFTDGYDNTWTYDLTK